MVTSIDIHKMLKIAFHQITLLLLLSFSALVANAESYPARCRVRTTLNVRSGPGTGYYKIGTLYGNDIIVVNSVTTNGSRRWGAIDYRGQTGYVAAQYVSYINPVEEKPQPVLQYSKSSPHHFSFSLPSFLDSVGHYVRIILLIIVCFIFFVFWEKILLFVFSVAFCAGIGALITYVLFDNSSIGAYIGGGIVLLVYLGAMVEVFFAALFIFIKSAYHLISFPSWFLNRLQFILMEPWRYLTKGYPSESVRSFFLPMVYPTEIILYLLITPLRFVNAVLYNIIIYGIIEFYDLLLETLLPSKDSEGGNNFFLWIIWFPIRLIKYPLIRGCMVLIEGAVWTVIDIFIPTITMYHGTDLTAAQCITGNDREKGASKKWTDGTFCSSQNGWAGAGAYFGSSRSTANSYAHDPYRLSDDNPVMIVCRVSLGKILNYGLAPRFIQNNTGYGGNHKLITGYAKDNGYTTGEWWNPKGYWEFCMHDWQNAYNEPWRIRPICVYNFKTGLVQHIHGGLRNWLFSEMVLRDILNNTRFVCLLIFAALVVVWLAYYGWNYLWDEYLWYYF